MKKTVIMLTMLAAMLTVGPFTVAARRRIHVVTTLQDYAAIARDIGGKNVEVKAIIEGNADPHHVKPKPSYALMLRNADLFVSTGLDLELWAPVLVNKSGNRKIVDGAPGYVSASHGVHLLEKPSTFDRTAGDVHIYGNPHIQTSPLNALVVAGNITTGLCKVDPSHCDFYKTNLTGFDNEIETRLYGKELVDLLGADVLNSLAAKDRLIPFLVKHNLMGKLGGWMKTALPLRGREIICYHKNWIYFTQLFGIKVVDHVEPKPGMPPTPRHVVELINEIKERHIKVLLAANYFERRKPQLIAERTGIIPVIVPTSVRGVPGVNTYFDLIDYWIKNLDRAFAKADH